MFTSPQSNLVLSDEGFSVKILGRTGIEYREGDRVAFIDSEMLAIGFGIAVFKKSISGWRPPHDKEAISLEQRHGIIENIRRAMLFLELPIEVL